MYFLNYMKKRISINKIEFCFQNSFFIYSALLSIWINLSELQLDNMVGCSSPEKELYFVWQNMLMSHFGCIKKFAPDKWATRERKKTLIFHICREGIDEQMRRRR
jgi:hypothetical protein